MFVEKVSFVDSLAYDFLLSLVRLNCNEMIISSYADQEFVDWFKPDAEIVDWVKETGKRLPPDIKELLDRFFNCETYFGVAMFSVIQQLNLKNPEELIVEIKRIPEKYLLSHFLRTGFGPDVKDMNLPNLEKIVEKITSDDKEMLMFITESTVFSPSQKANLMELFSDPAKAKEDYLYLLEWYLENVFNSMKIRVNNSNQRQLKLLEKNITENGDDYFQKLEIVTVPDILTKVSRIEIGVSQFLGIDQAHSMGNKERFLFILGYDRIEIPFREKDMRLECIDVFEALSSKERLAILRALQNTSYTPIAMSKRLKIPSGELNNHIEKLKKARLIESFLDGEHLKYTANPQEIKKIVDQSLKRLLEEGD
ncbi:MAG: winged helix-turn-helix domain-containing protein [Mesotoga sp.]|nr:winged helix-turn-helix domain-containing protein [Mesotoga sp.]